MKRIISLVLSLVLVIGMIPAFVVSADTESEFVFNKVSGEEVYLTGYNGDGGVVEIPSEYEGIPVTSITYNAFANQSGINEVVIPDTVKEVSSYAFENCTALNKVTFSENLITIGEYAFYNCKNLKIAELSYKTTDIGKYALGFYEDVKSGYSFLVDGFEMSGYTNSVAEQYAAENEITFTSIGIAPLYVYEVEETYDEEVKLARITKYNGKEENVVVPSEIDGYEINNIGRYAFENNDYIKTVTIPETVYGIQYEAFAGCENLTTVNLSSYWMSIRRKAFYGCTNLVNINYSEYFQCNIDEDVFTGTAYYTDNFKDNALYFANVLLKVDTSVKNFEFKDGITAIASEVFKGCTKLTSITIPGTVESIGENAFDGCTALAEVEFEPYEGYDLVYVSSYAFLNCPALKSVVLSEDIHPSYRSFGCSYEYVDTLGYWNYVQNEDFVIYGEKGGSIEEFANSYGIKFEEYDFSHTHTYKTVTTKATLTKNGKIVKKCACGDIKSTTTVYYPKTIKLSATSYTYNGAVKTPTVTVKDSSGKTVSSSNYTVTYASGRKNAGTYKVTVKMKGNYSGTKTLTFKINPRTTANCTYKLSTTSYTYNGAVKTPTVTVKTTAGTKLTKGTHYTVTYASGRKNVGTYKVTVKMKGNYTGTKTLTFKINPPKTTVSSLTAGKKSLKVYITKKSTQVTGYQIQYSTSKSFKSYKTKNISSYKTTSTTLSGLTAKKTYYVRVRTYKTVGGVKYYSGWSTYKYKKTK